VGGGSLLRIKPARVCCLSEEEEDLFVAYYRAEIDAHLLLVLVQVLFFF
jgi:hypothetical protein